MKNTTITLLVTLTVSVNLFSANKVIYGNDDRKDYFQMTADIKELANSVVSLWDKTNIRFDTAKNKYILTTMKFGDRLNLCNDEPFREQTIGAFCSGSLISEDTILTAGHCITNQSKCDSTYFVFGYAVKNRNTPDTPQTKFDSADVYKCQKIIKTNVGPKPTPDNPQGIGLGPDYAIIKLDKKVTNKKILKINTNQQLRAGQQMFVIGYPVGLPIKMADGAVVRDPSPIGYFVANLDTYGGNSGSPVFNQQTKLIEGILVRGDTDFVNSPAGCTISNRVDNNGGRGEDVTKISVLYKHLSGIVPDIKNTNTVKSISVETNFDSIDISKAIKFNFDRQ